MQLSLNWLKDFVEIPKNISPDNLGEKLTMHTVEVEKIEYQADKYKGVVVGKILEVNPHPNADRLRLAKVDVGSKMNAGRPLEIVCGASNIAPGQLVPVALVGAVLPNGLEIKPAEIRGVKSNGMLCAEDELDLGADHNGIMILAKAKIGQSLADYLKLDDVIFEVDNKSITHRADLWSHYGLARDISAFLNSRFKPLKIKAPASVKQGFSFKVKVEDYRLCPRYMAIGLEGIKIAPSPRWLADRLIAAGMRPINNIVDVTNYVMLEVGQPLHAFDKNFIDNIIVRRAKSEETIETLDGQTRKLEPEMLVIANQAKPVAVAGVMGGANSEISEQTAAIIIESANFDFNSIRKTSQKLGLRTESSMRFEKGLDPNLAELGLRRAVDLIIKICPGAKVVGKITDQKKSSLSGRQSKFIDFDLNWLNEFIGQEFKAKQVKQVLGKLGFGVKGSGSKLKVAVPTWRSVRDVSLAEDLAEEVARVYGYNNIKSTMPKTPIIPPPTDQVKFFTRKIKNILSLGGRLSEVYNYSFVGEKELKKIGAPLIDTVRLANPLSEDLAVLRTDLALGLLSNIKTNQANEEEVAIYEIGRIFLNKPGEMDKDASGREKLPLQKKRLGLALANGQEDDLFRKIKAVVEYLLAELNLRVEFSVTSQPAVWADKSTAAEILANGRAVGQAALAVKQARQSLGIKKSVALAEIDLTALIDLVVSAGAKQYSEPAKYPPVTRDLAFVVNDKILYNNIVKQIKNFSDLINRVELFDVYQGDKLGAGKKSLAFHVIYQADRTLKSEEVDDLQTKLIKNLEENLEAKIRDF